MTNTAKAAVQALDHEIGRREGELEALRLAREVIAGHADPPRPPRAKPERLALPAPAKKKARGKTARKNKPAKAKPAPAAFGGTVEVNKVAVTMTERQAKMMDLLIAAPEGECVSFGALLKVHGGHEMTCYADLRAMREALVAAKATIGNVRGSGYRLENQSG